MTTPTPIYTWKAETVTIKAHFYDEESHEDTSFDADYDGYALYSDGVPSGLGYYEDSGKHYIPTHLASGLSVLMKGMKEEKFFKLEGITRIWIEDIAPLVDWTQSLEQLKKTLKGSLLYHRTRVLLHTRYVEHYEALEKQGGSSSL